MDGEGSDRVHPSNFVGPIQPGDSYYYVASQSDARYTSIVNGNTATEFYYPPGTPKNLPQECVSLTKAFTGAPCTACWRMGPQVKGNGTIPIGAAIAAGWDARGRYPAASVPKNSAIYVGQTQKALYIIDQYPRDVHGNPHTARIRPLPFGSPYGVSNDGNSYHLITVPATCSCGR